jgi:hypothetical protein
VTGKSGQVDLFGTPEVSATPADSRVASGKSRCTCPPFSPSSNPLALHEPGCSSNPVEKAEVDADDAGDAGPAPVARAKVAPEPPVSPAIPRDDVDHTAYSERRLRGPLQIAGLIVSRIQGPRLGDESAPLAARCAVFRERLEAFRESLRASVPPRPIERLTHGWTR